MMWKKIIVAMLAVSVVFSGCARHGEIDTETPALTERVTEEPSWILDMARKNKNIQKKCKVFEKKVSYYMKDFLII